jgi:UPF0716 protein FxsA
LLCGETGPLRSFPFILIGGIIAEIWVFIKAGEAFGALPVLLAVVAAMLVGVAVIRRQGAKTLNSLREALAGAPLPKGGAGEAALVYLAGILLILPGFLSDIAAIALLIPMVRRMLLARLGRHYAVHEVHTTWPPRRQTRPPVIEGEAVDITPNRERDGKSPWQS